MSESLPSEIKQVTVPLNFIERTRNAFLESQTGEIRLGNILADRKDLK